ncbi:MAG TPA: MurR/RpiR family transcriptional regulator [Clostridia bacterium]|nr:MurR/RpiR family transcriptional regulator [Clostridia bacterium]
MDLLQDIQAQTDGLTKKQRAIADFLLENPEAVCYISLKELSRRTGASEVSILRLCRALGYDGYAALRDAFRARTERLSRGVLAPAFPEGATRGEDEKLQLLNGIFLSEQTGMNRFLTAVRPELLLKTARRLIDAEDVLVFGHDVSKILAEYFSYRLSFLHIKATPVALGDNDAVQNVLARLKKNDHVVLFSFPPYHMPIRGVAKYAEFRAAPVTVITDSAESPAVTEESTNLLCDTSTRFFYNSHTLPVTLINLIASCIAIEMGPRFDEILAEEQSVNRFISDILE